MKISRPDKDDPIGSLVLDIQLAIIECVKLMTAPRPQVDPSHEIIRTPSLSWKVEKTWNWTLRTTLALKSLTTQDRPHKINTNYGWTRDKESTDEMSRWTHEKTGAGQWDFPNLMKFEINIMSDQPLKSSTMDDWSTSSKASWVPINCNMATFLHLFLQHHPLGSLSEFRNNSLIVLQQRSPHGVSLGPHFFNHGDNLVDRRIRKISHLIHRVTGLQLPGTPLPLYFHPCQDPERHPIRTGTSQRPTGLNELVRSTSFVPTIYTIPYPQGHSGLQNYGNPLASSPILFDKEDPLPVYNQRQLPEESCCRNDSSIHTYRTQHRSDGYHFNSPPGTP